jgi:hypothetical protein
VFGFFVFQQQQGGMHNADGMLFSAGASQQSKAASDEKASSAMPAANSAPTASGQEVLDNAAAASGGGGQAEQQKEIAPVAPQPAETGRSTAQAQQPLNELKAKIAAPEARQQTGQGAGAPAPSGEGQAAAKPQAKASGSAPAADEPAGSSAVQQQQEQAISGTQPAPPPAPSPAGSAAAAPEEPALNAAPKPDAPAPEAALKQGPGDGPVAGIMGIAPNADAKNKVNDRSINGFNGEHQPMLSPNSEYTAAVNSDNQVVISDKQGKALFTSSRTAASGDAVTLVKWESETMFTYQVKNGELTVNYVINVTNKTEAKK